MKTIVNYFNKTEITLWSVSTAAIIGSFCLFDRANYLTLVASLIGVTALIFNAKGNPFGQLLMIFFSILYGIISFSFSYYGEMMTYLGMTAPMALLAMIAWLKNPYEGNRAEVRINHIHRREVVFLFVITALVTGVFYVLLAYFDTANMIPSTISVTTSFLAVYLTFRRSPYYAIGYAANDVILIVLWVLAAMENSAYISVVVCFAAFFINDLYGFLCWRAMGRRQSSKTAQPSE